MAGFTVDPDSVRANADTLKSAVADQYAAVAEQILRGGKIDAPGFGILLSPLEGAYIQRLDFLSKDVQGASDMCRQLGGKLLQVADQYEKAEELNIRGFGGTPVPTTGFDDAYARTGAATMASSVAGGSVGVLAAGVITVAEISAVLATAAACGALCPTFLPAVAAAVTIVADIPSIASAGSALIQAAQDLQGEINANFAAFTDSAASTWEHSEARNAYVMVANRMKSHLAELADYIKTLGEGLHSLVTVLSGLWIAIAAMVGPFLVWLVASRAAQLFPPAAPGLEIAIEASGLAMAATVSSTIAAAAAIGGTLVALLQGLFGDFLKLMTLPDKGAAGVPDLTEFTVGENFRPVPTVGG
jgi:hypothetical protein